MKRHTTCNTNRLQTFHIFEKDVIGSAKYICASNMRFSLIEACRSSERYGCFKTEYREMLKSILDMQLVSLRSLKTFYHRYAVLCNKLCLHALGRVRRGDKRSLRYRIQTLASEAAIYWSKLPSFN